MNPGSFCNEDRQKIVEFLNITAKKAMFTMSTQDIIEYYKLLSFMQNTVLTKVEANILEITRVVEAASSKEEEASKE